jgi:hypothetical protein
MNLNRGWPGARRVAGSDSPIPFRVDRDLGPLDLSGIVRPRFNHTASVSDLTLAVGSWSDGGRQICGGAHRRLAFRRGRDSGVDVLDAAGDPDDEGCADKVRTATESMVARLKGSRSFTEEVRHG